MKHTHKHIFVATPIVIAILLIAFVGAYAPALSVATAEEELHYGAILSSSTSTETVSYASYTEETYHDNTNFPSYYNTDSALTNVCAPVAGADVIGYFDRNYTNLIPSWNPGYTSGSNYQYYPQLTPFVTYIQGVISALYTQMGTNTTGDGTTRAQYQAGLTSYVQNAGYSISFSNSMSGTIPNVSTIKTQLQAGKVVSLYLNGYTYTTPTLTSTAATYSHTTYTGTHVAIAYGYRIIRYYNASGVNFRTDTLLKVATGQASSKYAYVLVSSSLTTFVAADVTNVY